MYLPQESYGNFESWGTSFSKQAILQACASVHVDGTVILGRGLPLSWLRDGSVIEWANVNINDGRTMDFTISSNGHQVQVQLRGDLPLGQVRIDLPGLAGNIDSATTGRIQNDSILVLEPQEREVTISLRTPVTN